MNRKGLPTSTSPATAVITNRLWRTGSTTLDGGGHHGNVAPSRLGLPRHAPQPRHRLKKCVGTAVCLSALLTACVYRLTIPREGPYLVDSGNRSVATLDVGASLRAAANGLAPGRLYDFELSLDGEQLSFARLTANTRGEIAPFNLWFHSGVGGCSLREDPGAELPRFMFRDFEEAQRVLDGRHLSLTISRTDRDPDAALRATSAERNQGLVTERLEVPVRARRSPMVFPSTAEGCLLNSAEAVTQDMFVSGRHFEPGGFVEVRVVANQRLWRVGDIANDITGASGAAEPERVQVDSDGSFSVRVWGRALQTRGAYDDIVRRDLDEANLGPWLLEDDVISYASDTAYLLFLRYPPGGPLMDIAGRQLGGSPYFEFADAFAETDDDVWGAVDPTYVSDTHPGGRYAAYYVVGHRNVLQWGVNTGISDVTGGIEIMPVKAGCINATDIVIWAGAKPVGEYDVVVNFGSTPAETAATFSDDMTYDAALDFLDGADQIGFRVAQDPYELGTIAIGEAEYSFDDQFATLSTCLGMGGPLAADWVAHFVGMRTCGLHM